MKMPSLDKNLLFQIKVRMNLFIEILPPPMKKPGVTPGS
jgi:hypothetical protein